MYKMNVYLITENKVQLLYKDGSWFREYFLPCIGKQNDNSANVEKFWMTIKNNILGKQKTESIQVIEHKDIKFSPFVCSDNKILAFVIGNEKSDSLNDIYGIVNKSIIDFSNCSFSKTAYGGSSKKFGIIFNNDTYMIKFPKESHFRKEQPLNIEQITEYLASEIIATTGINVHKTLLGEYKIKNKPIIVVACKDFEISENAKLIHFKDIKNRVVDSDENGDGTKLSHILEAIDSQIFYNKEELRNWFWDLFVVDAWLANQDRHNDNWGLLKHLSDNSISIAPVYDNGGCLYPNIPISYIENVFKNKEELDMRIRDIPTSKFIDEDYSPHRIKYYDYIRSCSNEDCNRALIRMYPKLDVEKATKIIDSVSDSILPSIRKQFLKLMLKERKEQIIDFANNKLKKGK